MLWQSVSTSKHLQGTDVSKRLAAAKVETLGRAGPKTNRTTLELFEAAGRLQTGGNQVKTTPNMKSD